MFGKNEAVGGVYRKKIGGEGIMLQVLRTFVCLFVWMSQIAFLVFA